jgi:formate hydrogenlyase transcriptional activator
MSVLALVVDLVDALADAHAPRALERELAATLARHPRELHGDPAVQRVIAAARRHVAVIERVARVSRRAHGEVRRLLAERAPAIVARSPAMRAALERVALVAPHPTTVLLTGESGTGKEVLARELHRCSPRARGPLVALNCGALPDALVQSELFGHERGAFTGAERAHAGAFERAHGGTLFLDEVGELPAPAQVVMLRALQERRFCRVGGETELAVDVRVVAATNRSPATLRHDLYYRLAVFAIAVPPLRERTEDLAPLAAQLLRELGAEPSLLTSARLARLAGYDWPGNVRELRNVLETALVLGELPELPRRRSSSSFADAQRAAIEAALRASRGKLYGTDGAAARLGLPPSTLQSKLQRLGMRREQFRSP